MLHSGCLQSQSSRGMQNQMGRTERPSVWIFGDKISYILIIITYNGANSATIILAEKSFETMLLSTSRCLFGFKSLHAIFKLVIWSSAKNKYKNLI